MDSIPIVLIILSVGNGGITDAWMVSKLLKPDGSVKFLGKD